MVKMSGTLVRDLSEPLH